MTLNIHIVTVAYNLPDDLLTFYRCADAPNVTFHLFQHSAIPEVTAACERICRDYPPERVYYYAHKVNRGLSTSWNDGLLAGYENGADVVLIANDDITCTPDDVQHLAEEAYTHRDCFHVVGDMVNVPTGATVDSQFGLCAVNPIALDAIGMFDENIFPIYWEDVDYIKRARLAHLREHHIGRTNIVHQGSKSSVSVPGMVQYLSQFYNLNQAYYYRKWGGASIGHELYDVPFNNPAFSISIAPAVRHAPYPGYNRTDQHLVVG